jgi:type IX secretion system PorP/SprF family membrane protein
MLRCCVKIACLFFLMRMLSFGQGVHFSEFRLLPNVINPAFTGFFEGDVRAGLVYRNQSPTYDNAFNTLGFGLDFSLLKQKSPSSIIGLGLHGYYDRAGSVRFTDNTLMLNFSYTQVLDKLYKYYLSFGMQTGVAFRSIDLSRATLDENFNGFDGFYEGQVTEPGILSRNSYFKLGIGALFFAQPLENFNIFVGGGIFDLTRSDLSFYQDVRFEQPKRFTLQYGSEIRVNKQISLMPGFYMQMQQPHSEYVIGMMMQYKILSKNNSTLEKYAIGLGANYRIRDAVIITTQLHYKLWKMNFSYDISVSKIRQITKTVGAIEIALIYEPNIFKNRKIPELPMACPHVSY